MIENLDSWNSKSSWSVVSWQRRRDFWGFDQALLTMACDSRGTWSSILLDFLKEGNHGGLMAQT